MIGMHNSVFIFLSQALECDINAHQDTFASLNETGQVVMADLAPGEVLTALQSKLDDMNDRWNSLNARSVDVGDKLDGGATEWRQLFLDLQEIVDWIERAIQQLEAQKPVGSDIETVTVQNDTHQVRKSIRDDPYWISRKNSLELIELSSLNKVSLVYVSFCSNTGSIRDGPYWISRKNSLELIELSSIDKVSLV